MYKLTEYEKEYISKIRPKVEKLYPGCYLEYTDEGYTIMDSGDSDILAEYILPVGKTPIQAWELAALTAKTTQNFNRSHPERLSLEIDEDKLSRMSRRRNKS